MDDVSKGILDFSDYVWGSDPGQVYLATMEQGAPPIQYMLQWPRARKSIPQFVLSEAAAGRDVYFCPSLFVLFEQTVEFNSKGKTAATRSNTLGARTFWVDIDGYKANQSKPPEDWGIFCKEKDIPEPTLIIQPSVAESQHVYWQVNKFVPAEELENVNRSLAAITGADLSGWESNQLLRMPFTSNYGYRKPDDMKAWYDGEPLDAAIIYLDKHRQVTAAQFSAMAKAETEVVERLEASLGPIESLEKVLAFGTWTQELFDQMSMTEQEASDSSPDKRSGAIMRLTYLAVEAGMTDSQVYTILDNADKRWKKYATRSPKVREKLLLDMIAKARVKLGYDDDLTSFANSLAGAVIKTEPTKVVYRWDELLDSEFNMEWVIGGILSTTGYMIITGAPGVGKTQVGLQIAINLALGNSQLFGFHIPGGQRKGMMFSLEMGKESVKYIGEKIDRGYPNQRREIGKNFNVVPLGKAINILGKDGRTFVENLLSEYKPDFLYIDSLKKVMPESPNDIKAVTRMNDTLQYFREEYRCAIILVHHDRKGQNGKKLTDKGDLSDMLGGTYIAGDADSVLSLRKTTVKGTIVLDEWKSRLEEESESKYLIRDSNLKFDWRYERDENLGDLRIIGDTSNSGKNPDESGPTLRT